MTTTFDAYIDSNKARFLDELGVLLRQPSVAAQGIGIAETAALVRERLERLGATTRLLSADGGEHAARSDLDAPVVRAAVASARLVYGLEPIVFPTMAGTGPMYPLCQALGTPVTSGAGCGYHGAQVHAPNEHIRVDDYWLAMPWMGAFIKAFAAA